MIGFDQGSTAASFNHSVVIAITMAMVIALARQSGSPERVYFLRIKLPLPEWFRNPRCAYSFP